MAKLIFLGTANSVPDEDHENTHMVIVGRERTILIDCVGSPILRLKKAGVDHNDLTDMVLTHFHPDHVSGVPPMLMQMWLLGRKKPLNIYGLHYTIDRIEDMMRFYSWADWPDFFPVAFYRLPSGEMTPVLDCPEFRIFSSNVRHFVPTIGLRVEFKESGKLMAYSCDTEPCEQVVRLADGVDVLVHEATGPYRGHSSAGQAGEIASQAEAGGLILIHYQTAGKSIGDELIREAGQHFQGRVEQAQDFMSVDF
jgi:ribonuclease Z